MSNEGQRRKEEVMADTPAPAQKQQGDGGKTQPQQQGGSAGGPGQQQQSGGTGTQQAGQPIFRDWASI